jgi:hypothetical protein
MKTKLLFAALSCLFLFSVGAYAQMHNPSNPFSAAQRNTPMMQQAMKNGTKTALRSFWDGNGANLMAAGMLMDPEIRTTLGVTDDQFTQIQDAMNPMAGMQQMQENPELKKIQEEMQAMRPAAFQNMLSPNPDKEMMDKMLELQGKMSAFIMNSMSENIDNVLGHDLKQKMMESQLAIMGEMPIISPNMFEALHLSDAQREQMNQIKKELEPDFEKNLETFADNSVIMANKMFDEMEKEGGAQNLFGGDPTTIRDRMPAIQEKMQAIQKKLMADPEYKRIHDEMQTTGQVFATQFKTKMFDILTDAQWKRLQELTDNPPEYAKIILKKMKEQRGESEKAGAGAWQPGPDSWRPGQAIPEQYRQERNTRGTFPRPAN